LGEKKTLVSSFIFLGMNHKPQLPQEAVRVHQKRKTKKLRRSQVLLTFPRGTGPYPAT